MCNLPKEVVIPKKDLEDIMDCLDTELANYLSDEYGFCIFSLDYKEEGNNIIAFDIKWDTTE